MRRHLIAFACLILEVIVVHGEESLSETPQTVKASTDRAKSSLEEPPADVEETDAGNESEIVHEYHDKPKVHKNPDYPTSKSDKHHGKTKKAKKNLKSITAQRKERIKTKLKPAYKSTFHSPLRKTRNSQELKNHKSDYDDKFDLNHGHSYKSHRDVDHSNRNKYQKSNHHHHHKHSRPHHRHHHKENGTYNIDGRGIFGAITGTAVSAINAVGQTISNWAGEGNVIGSVGGILKNVAKSFSGSLKYVLFTPKNPTQGIIFNATTVAYTTYDPTQELIIIIHGYTMAGYFDNPNDNLISSFKIKDALLQAKFKSNIVLVDWTTLSSDATYIFSSSSTATVGEDIADFILRMLSSRYLPYLNWVRIIGYSLGAHAAGIAGSKVYQKSKQLIGHIDGLDPAGPNFDGYTDQRFQLSPTDAALVQVIHCNTKFLGTKLNRGRVDFYPQGGNDLPGCDAQTMKLSGKTSLPLGMENHMCNHERCIDVYIEALTTPFIGCKCSSYAAYTMGICPCQSNKKPHLGYYCEDDVAGVFYVNVKLKSPYQMYPENYATYFQYGGVTMTGNPVVQPFTVLPPPQLPVGIPQAPFGQAQLTFTLGR